MKHDEPQHVDVVVSVRVTTGRQMDRDGLNELVRAAVEELVAAALPAHSADRTAVLELNSVYLTVGA